MRGNETMSMPGKIGKTGTLLVLALVLATGLGACQTTKRASGYNPTPQEQALAERNGRFNQTIGEGVLAGAALGALIGGLAGDWEGAAIGAASGALVGGAAGYFVASENQSYASAEQALNGQIQQARAQIAGYQQDLQMTRELVATRRTRIAQVNAQLRAGQISQAQYQAERAQLQSAINVVQENIRSHEHNIQLIQQEISRFQAQGYNTSALQQELYRYRSLRDEQLGLLNQLVQASQTA
ncbi:MAG: hypothetical protein H6842_01715 [Rhodospirillaceae bacterium]|nr:hypothetical protein [Rhodospirillaceae bacterium]